VIGGHNWNLPFPLECRILRLKAWTWKIKRRGMIVCISFPTVHDQMRGGE
jgi:hypothetical protein